MTTRFALPATRLALAAALLASGCNRATAPAVVRAPVAATAPAPPPPPPELSAEAPDDLLGVGRGNSLRRTLPWLFAQGGDAEVIDAVARQITPGIGDHAADVDPDLPFAIVGTVSDPAQPEIALAVAWPLRAGAQLGQDARSGRGLRERYAGVFVPDGDAARDDECWVIPREPAGWTALCGRNAALPRVAGLLRQTVRAPGDALLSLEVRADRLRPMVANAVTRGELAAGGPWASLLGGVESLSGVLSQDDERVHVRLRGVVDATVAAGGHTLFGASVDHPAPVALLQTLPAVVHSYMAAGFDRAGLASVLGAAPRTSPNIPPSAFPELSHAVALIDEVRSATPRGPQAWGCSDEDGYTMYYIQQRADAAAVVSELRAALRALPNRDLPDGTPMRGMAALLPTPGLPPARAVRVGRTVRIPRGVDVPAEVRESFERSLLVVADGDRLVAVAARDPVARYRAMSRGPRLAVTSPAGAVYLGHLRPRGFIPLFYGSRIPGLSGSGTDDAVDFALVVERAGEGGRAELRVDAPIGAGTEVRETYEVIQEMIERARQPPSRPPSP